jgi:hypothetical protein
MKLKSLFILSILILQAALIGNASSLEVPTLNENSTSKDINTFVEYYKAKGFTVLEFQQEFYASGMIKKLSFNAERKESLSPNSTNTTFVVAKIDISKGKNNISINHGTTTSREESHGTTTSTMNKTSTTTKAHWLHLNAN